LKEEYTMNTAIAETNTVNHPVVSSDLWLAERKALLAREKELTRLSDQIARERRALPWQRVEKHYLFDAPEGSRTLADLFEGRRQLLVQHFMFGPGWEQGCPSCSFMADHSDGMKVHLAHRDTTLVAVSRAPLQLHAGRRNQWRARLQLRNATLPGRGSARYQRFLQGRGGRRLSHLLDLRARRGGDDGHVPAARPHTPGP
jgi:predicted dithiol-disulfide oxidoreductase (DUF899 family)